MFTLKTLPRTLAALALVAAFPMVASAQAKDPVKVGLVSSKSGVFAEQGGEVINAIKFAIDEAMPKVGWMAARWKWRKVMTRARPMRAAAWPRSCPATVTTC